MEMPFGELSQMGPWNHVLDADADPQGEGAIYGGIVRLIEKH